MKRFLITLSFASLLIACGQNSAQIDAAKNKLAELGVSDPGKYEYKASEVSGLDVYKKIATKYTNQSHDLKDIGDYEGASKKIEESNKNLTLAEANKDKKFGIVNAYELAAGDTLHKIILYVDDKNTVIDFENLK